MSKTKLRTPQTPPSFSTTRVGLKRVQSKKSRLSGDSFERARQPRLHSNCTQFGAFTRRDTHAFHTLTHVHSFRLCIPTDTDRPFNILKSGFLSKPTASGMSDYSHHSILSVTNLGTYRSVCPFSACDWNFHQDGRKIGHSDKLGSRP
jgi:hypothetical protein